MSKNSPIKMKTVTKLSNPAKNEIVDGANDDVLSNYLREISDYRALSTEEEKDLAKRAKNGDFIAFSGELGNSLKGLKILQNGGFLAKNARFKKPVLRSNFIFLSARYLSSCMDISDGLLNDLPKLLKKHQRARLNKILSKFELLSGEEYEALFTFSPKNKPKIQNIAKKCRLKLNIIGQVTKARSNLPKFRAFSHF